MKTIRSIFPWLLLLVVLISAIAAWLYARIVTKPAIALSRVSEEMADLNLDWSCEETRTDELGILAHSLNKMARKLTVTLTQLQEANISLQNDIDKEKKSEQARLEFFSAVYHELKTPVTIIKGQLEGMLLNVGAYQNRD